MFSGFQKCPQILVLVCEGASERGTCLHLVIEYNNGREKGLSALHSAIPTKRNINDNNFHFCPPSHQATGRNLSICSYFEILSRKNGLPPTAIYCVVLVKGFSDISTVFSCYIDAGLME